MSDLLDSYRAHGPGHDEMLQSTGTARVAWEQMADLAGLHSWSHLDDARTEVSTMLADQWVRYGTDSAEAPWALDPLPVILDEVEWAGVEAALRQRADLLDVILTDLYGPRRLIADGLIPADLVLGHPGFLRPADGIALPGPRQLFLHATDLARNADGGWRVLADRTQAPSGLGFAMADRRVIAQALSGLYRQARIRRLGPFFRSLATALREVAPPSAGDNPQIAVLTPGPYSETAFDQGYLAAMLGLPLVQGEDLEVAQGRLWMRSLQGREPVDVLLRRVDADYCDPLDLRGDSRLGVPGLVQVAREGALSVVNTLGSGILENPALLTYLPQLCRSLRDEELLLPSAVTYWCGKRSMCSHVIAHLDRLVLRHTAPGSPAVRGWELTPGQRADLAAAIAAQPRQWVGQEPVEASTTPTVGSGSLQALPTSMRTFAVARPHGYEVLAGALVQVRGRDPDQDTGAGTAAFDTSGAADAPGALAGTPEALAPAPEHTGADHGAAVAKDLWVLSTEPQPVLEPWPQEPAEPAGAGHAATISAGAAQHLFWFGRYAERAEATVRLIQVVTDLWADHHAHPRSPGGQCLAVLEHLLAQVTTTGSPQDLLTGTAPGTVPFAVDRMLRNATAVRDQLSADTWLALSGINRAIERARAQQRREAQGRGSLDVPRAAARITEGLLALAGIGAESMMRDVGWSLLDIGRRIERAQHLVATLRAALAAAHPPEVETGVCLALLTAHESAITYRRRQQHPARLDSVVDLLVLDAHHPRSLAYQVEAIGTRLTQVPTPVRDASSRDQLLADVRDLLTEADPGVLAGPNGGREHLAEFLESVHWRLAELAHEIARVHFTHPVPSQWLDAVGTWVPDAQQSAGATPTGPGGNGHPEWTWGHGGLR